MRRFLSFFLLFAASFALVSCGEKNLSSSGSTVEQPPVPGISAKTTTLLLGRYQDYTKNNFKLLTESGDKKVLVFAYSVQCTECRATTLSIIKAFASMKRIDIAGFKYAMGMDPVFEKAHNVQEGEVIVFKGKDEVARKQGTVSEEEIIELMK